MKKLFATCAALMALAAPAAFAAMDHGSMDMDHGKAHDMSGKGGHDMMKMGNVAHEEVVDGVKATFKVMSMKEHMQEMPEGMKETSHVMVNFKDAKTGKPITQGEVKLKVLGPDKSEQTKDLMGMQGHFGADFNMSKKGKYGIMCKFKVKDGKVRQSKFWYTEK